MEEDEGNNFYIISDSKSVLESLIRPSYFQNHSPVIGFTKKQTSEQGKQILFWWVPPNCGMTYITIMN